MRKAAQLISCRECPRLQYCWELLADNTVSNENWPTDQDQENPEEGRRYSHHQHHQDNNSHEKKTLSNKLIAFISNGVRYDPSDM